MHCSSCHLGVSYQHVYYQSEILIYLFLYTFIYYKFKQGSDIKDFTTDSMNLCPPMYVHCTVYCIGMPIQKQISEVI
jgi:hypothetical protein